MPEDKSKEILTCISAETIIMVTMFDLLFAETAKKQYSRLNPKLQRQVDNGLERIAANPRVGKPLGGNLKGIWSERVATFRILYKIFEERSWF